MSIRDFFQKHTHKTSYRLQIFNWYSVNVNSFIYPCVLVFQHYPRWATIWVLSLSRNWWTVTLKAVWTGFSSWTASFRSARSSRAWPKPSARKTPAWLAMWGWVTKTSCLVPLPGWCKELQQQFRRWPDSECVARHFTLSTVPFTAAHPDFTTMSWKLFIKHCQLAKYCTHRKTLPLWYGCLL